MNEGWKCPVCGRGVSPNEKHCDHGGQQVVYGPVIVPTPVWPDPYRGTGIPWEPPPPVTCETIIVGCLTASNLPH